METAATHAADPIAIGSRALSRDDALAVLGNRLDGLTRYPKETTRAPLGTYQGLAFGLILHPHTPPAIYLEGATVRQTGLSRDHQGARAVLNGLERLASGYAADCDRVERDLNLARSQLRDYQGNLDKPFLHDRYLSKLTALRDQLKAGLSATTADGPGEDGASVADLAEQIKSLLATNAVEVTSERTGQRQSTAEEPVTARIRRRQRSNDPSLECESLPEPDENPAQQYEANPPANQSGTFQERLARETHDLDRGLPKP
jgi:hypothetical protein